MNVIETFQPVSDASTVLVVDASGDRMRVSADVARRMMSADAGAYVRRPGRDGTLGASGEDVVMLSGLFSSIGNLAKGVFNAGKSVVGTVAPIVGAGAGFLIGGPAGVAVGAQIGSVVKNTVAPSQRQSIERKARGIAERFALAGVQITGEQAVALAQMSEAQVNAQLKAAQAQQAATASAGVGRQIYAPAPPPVAQLAAESVPQAAPSSDLPMPLLLGGVALAAILLLKK